MKNWVAKWITDANFSGLEPLNLFHKQNSPANKHEHRKDLKNHHILVRKKFYVDEMLKDLFLDITADDYYKLFINGRYVAQGPAPGYPFHYWYNRLDVTSFIRPGENVIAVHIYYQGLINRVWCSGDYRQGLIAELHSGDRVLVETDSSWRYTPAKEYVGEKTFGYDTQFVENIDNRLKITGWKGIQYDDSEWMMCRVNEKDDHVLFLQPAPLLNVYEMKPEITRVLREGHYFIDFGREIAGHIEMNAMGNGGETVQILYGEELNEDGSVRFDTRCNCYYGDTWILAGGENEFEPFDYKAFRYVEVRAPANTVIIDSVKALVRHYPMDDKSCSFHSSSPLLNKTWEICTNSVRVGCQEVYVDCPSREKGQYLGDATVTSLAQLYLTGDTRLYKKYLKDFALSSAICPGLMAVAPCSHMQEIADFSLLWPYQLLNYYLHSGDKDFLERMLPIAEGILAYFQKFERDDGLLENVKDKWNLVDWPEQMRDGYDFDLSPVVGDGCHNVINALYAGAVKTVDEIRTHLGKNPTDRFKDLKEAYIRAFFRHDLQLFADSTVSDHCAVHSNIYPLFYDLADPSAVKSIIRFIREKGMACGVFTAFILLKGLARAGEFDLVYELLTSTGKNSWANMLREGATSCFEAWGKDQKWNTSLCHPWASAPIPVIIEDIIGLSPGKPGWETVHFKPHIPASLDSLELEFTTKRGRICVKKDSIATEMRLKASE